MASRKSMAPEIFSFDQTNESGVVPSRIGPVNTDAAAWFTRWIVPAESTSNAGQPAFSRANTTSEFIKSAKVALTNYLLPISISSFGQVECPGEQGSHSKLGYSGRSSRIGNP